MLLKKIKNTIRKYNLIAKGDKIVVGVSGGPDSVALLYLLNSLKKEFRLTLHIAHLDHMLRKNSHKDSEYVRKLSRKLKIPFTLGRIKVRELAKKGSLEEIARNARLSFLFKVAKDLKAKKIALGHNLNDQAETVLMRILRGTGLYGLAGILPKREIAGYVVIRPLVDVTRNEVEGFLKKKNIRPRRDESNLNDAFLRNRIRHKLLPLLEKEYNANIKELLSNMAETVGSDYDYLTFQAAAALKRMNTRLNINKLKKIHPAMLRLILRLSLKRVKGDMRRITFKHIKEIEDLILNRPLRSIVDLPSGISVVKKKSLTIYRRKPQ